MTAYTPTGQIRRTVTPVGAITTSLFDGADRGVGSINPIGFRTTMVVDASDRTTATLDSMNQRTTTAYDSVGRSIGAVAPRDASPPPNNPVNSSNLENKSPEPVVFGSGWASRSTTRELTPALT
jgi:YD repeat-containing protein